MPIPNIRQITAPYAAQVQIGYARGVPPAVNDRAATGAFSGGRGRHAGPGRSAGYPQSMGAEDLALAGDQGDQGDSPTGQSPPC
jgi:amidohydrolase